MARTASLDAGDAEKVLGPRGGLRVFTGGPQANRDMVRKWLVANGVSSQLACKLQASLLQAAYNDMTDTTLDRLREQSEAPAPFTVEAIAPDVPVTNGKS